MDHGCYLAINGVSTDNRNLEDGILGKTGGGWGMITKILDRSRGQDLGQKPDEAEGWALGVQDI